MASSSSTQELIENAPIHLICPICYCSLVENLTSSKEVVRAFCGHVYHKICIKRAYNNQNSGKDRVNYEYVCPLCSRKSKSERSIEITLEPLIDRDQEKRIKENEELKTQNQDLNRRLNVAELRLVVLRQNTDELRRRLGELKWEDLTESFQNELTKKLDLNCHSLDINKIDLSFLSSGTLFELINSEYDKNLLIINFTQDLYNNQSSLHENLTLHNFKDIFKYNLFDWLTSVSKLTSLDLRQLPVSPKILQLLMNVEENLLPVNSGLIIKIVELYLHDYKCHTQDMMKVMLVKLISDLLHKEPFYRNFEIQIPFVQQSVLSYLEKTGIVKRKNGVLDITHDSVKFYFVGMITMLIRQKLSLCYVNARECFYSGSVGFGTLEYYCIGHLNGWNYYGTDLRNVMENELVNSINFNVTNNLDLLVILIVLKLQNTKDLAKVLRKFERLYTVDGRNIWEVMYPCKIDSHIQYLTLPQFAAIRSNLAVTKKIYDMIDPAERSIHFDFRKLVRLCGYGTLFKTDDEILERIEVISFLLTLNESKPERFMVEPDINCLTVHVKILKFVVGMGMNYFRVIWNINHIIDLVSPHLDGRVLEIFRYNFLDHDLMMDILTMYSSVRPLTNYK